MSVSSHMFTFTDGKLITKEELKEILDKYEAGTPVTKS